jgi:hypothetical protein
MQLSALAAFEHHDNLRVHRGDPPSQGALVPTVRGAPARAVVGAHRFDETPYGTGFGDAQVVRGGGTAGCYLLLHDRCLADAARADDQHRARGRRYHAAGVQGNAAAQRRRPERRVLQQNSANQKTGSGPQQRGGRAGARGRSPAADDLHAVGTAPQQDIETRCRYVQEHHLSGSRPTVSGEAGPPDRRERAVVCFDMHMDGCRTWTYQLSVRSLDDVRHKPRQVALDGERFTTGGQRSG